MRGIAAVLTAISVIMGVPSFGESVGNYSPGESMPVDAVIEDLRDHLEEQPDDAEVLFQLGQLYNYIYGYGMEYVWVTEIGETGVGAPEVPPVFSSNAILPITVQRIKRLAEALVVLRRGVELAPDNYMGRLALGFAYMEAAKRYNAGDWIRDRVPVDEAALEEVGERAYWENLALEHLRIARASETAPEQNESAPEEFPSQSQPQLAAYYIFQILAGRDMRTEAEQAELDELRKKALEFANGRSLLVSINGRPESDHQGNVSDAALAEVLAIYPFVPPKENAAELYLRAMDTARAHYSPGLEDDLPFFSQTELGLPAEPLGEGMLQQIRACLALNAEPLRLVHEGGKLSKSRYPIDMRLTHAVLLPHLAQLRNLARLKALEAIHAAETGDEAGAVRALCDGIALVRSVRREPTLISQLVRIACSDIAAKAAEQVLNRVAVAESNLLKLQAEFGSLEDSQDMVTGFMGERWLWTIPIPIAQEDVRQRAISERARKGQSFNEPLRSDFDFATPDTKAIEVTDEEMKSMEQKLRAEYAEALGKNLADCERLISLAELPVTEMHQSLKALQEEEATQSEGRVVGPARPRALVAQVRTVARLRVVQTALAIERYRLRNGDIPDDLQALAPDYLEAEILEDPFTGELLRYAIEDDHHVVYSVADEILNERHTQGSGTGPSAISFSMY
jgi:hypothetical protein